MKQEYINKFECKIMLNKAIDERNMSKEDFEFIIKHILKSNLLLVKHYNMIKKYGNLSNILDKCNELLSWEFFVNDKILMIWLARALNKILKDNYTVIGVPLKDYLKEKYQSIKENLKYDRQLSHINSCNSVIICDDGCWDMYLPIKKSEQYYSWNEEKDLLYPQFDEELGKLFIYSKNQFNKDELNNIKLFEFCYIDEDELIKQINDCIKSFKEDNSWEKRMNVDLLLSMIYQFDDVDVRLNVESHFWSLIDKIKFDLFDLMKNDMFKYDVNKDFIIVDKNEYGKVIEIISIDDIHYLIDIPQWIRYMNVHNIKNIDEMYIDKEYFNKGE